MQNKSFSIDQQPEIEKLRASNWQKGFAYDTEYRGEVYHLVQEGTELATLQNTREIKKLQKSVHLSKMS